MTVKVARWTRCPSTGRDFCLLVMGIGVLDRRALPAIGGPDVVQAEMLMLGDLNFGHRVTPRLLKNRSFADHCSGRKDVVY